MEKVLDLDIKRSRESQFSSFLQFQLSYESRMPFLELFHHIELYVCCMCIKSGPLCDYWVLEGQIYKLEKQI